MFETLFAPGLDASSEAPLNEQLQAMLRHAILNGSLPAGHRLPASRALADRLAISRNTVLAAYEHLVAEGYLETRQGAGTYVSADLPDTSLTMTAVPDGTRTSHNVREKKAARPLSGMPALDQFPTDIWARIAGSVWRHADAVELLYNDPAGYLPLRRTISAYLEAARGLTASPDQIVITSGLQQGVRLVMESVVDGDRAIVLEDPGYPGMTTAAKTLSNPIVYTRVDKDGAVPPKMAGVPAGLMVTSPSRQYPLGQTMPLKRRLEILEWAQRENCFILEDDYDSEFRYAGRPINSLQGIDGGERVIYGGSFSKSLFLALRLGYLVLPLGLVDRVLKHRAAVDSFPSISNQLMLTRFIEEGHFARHIRRLRGVHKTRLGLFMDAAREWLSPYFTFEQSDTGLHVVATSKLNHLSDVKLSLIAGRAGIGASPLSETYRACPPQHGLLFGFANLQEREINNRLKELATLLSQQTGF
ncbi:PLP-dependent aminotransferase family protein [Kordiimonas sp.]|uniref:MocR-like pyridoxine biosynthesis transcription factor PdxR n=1 Tax=Kordiimonas sp. TaxID=1970157 RepID=UPI003A916F97